MPGLFVVCTRRDLPTLFDRFNALMMQDVPKSNGNGKHAHAPEQKAISIAPGVFPADFWPIDSNGGTVDVVRADWYASHWLVHSAVRLRAMKFSEPTLWVRQYDAETDEFPWLKGDHPILPLLKRPNPDMRLRELLFATSVLLDTTGACLWVKNRDRGQRVGSVYPFGAEDFVTESDGTRMFARFRVNLSNGTQRLYDATEVVHFREYGGVAPLHAARRRLSLDHRLVEAMDAALRNSITAGATLEYPVDFNPTDEQQAELKYTIAAQYESARNTGKLMVLGGGGTLNRQPFDFSKIGAGDVSREIEAAVCACFNVPPGTIGAMIGLETQNDRASSEQTDRRFYDNAVLPRWQWVQEVLTTELLPDFDRIEGRDLAFDLRPIGALQEDLTEKAEIIAKVARFVTVNEARSWLGLAPLDGPEGDEMGAAAPQGSAATDEATDDEPEGDEPKSAAGPTEAKAHLAWTIFDATARAGEFAWELEAANLLNADRDMLVRFARDIIRGTTKDDEAKPDPETVQEYKRRAAEYLSGTSLNRWKERVLPLIEAGARQAAERASIALGIRFDLLTPGVLEYTRKEAGWLVKQITETTRNSLADALAAGLEEGESISKLTTRISQSGAFDRERARLIARTETTRVQNGAQADTLATYSRETGNPLKKTWLSAQDDRVRDEHAALNGETKGITEAFSNGLQAPGEPNCRCTLTYSLEGAT